MTYVVSVCVCVCVCVQHITFDFGINNTEKQYGKWGLLTYRLAVNIRILIL